MQKIEWTIRIRERCIASRKRTRVGRGNEGIVTVAKKPVRNLAGDGVEEENVMNVIPRPMESIVVAAVKNRATQQLGENDVEDDGTVVDVMIHLRPMESIVVAAVKNRAT